MHRARTVGRRHDERGLVLARRRGVMVAQHQKARGVVRIVFDVSGDQLEAVARNGDIPGDRRGAGLLRRQARRLRIACHGYALGIGQLAVQPLVALRQRLRVGIDARDLLQQTRLGHQILAHAQHRLGADHERSAEQKIVRAVDRPFARIFHRNHAVIHAAGLGLAEHFVDGTAGMRAHVAAEHLQHRHLAEGAGRAQIGHRQRLFQRAAG